MYVAALISLLDAVAELSGAFRDATNAHRLTVAEATL